MKWLLIIFCFFFFSCSSSKYIETCLYFGQTRPDGSMITEKEWNDFKENHIIKVFKEGNSVFSSVGNWYDTAAHKMITEPSYMVVYNYKKSSLISRQIDSLANLYKKLFNQQSVLRVDKKTRTWFL